MNEQNPFAHLPHNQAAENNKAPILDALETLGLLSSSVLEIGSGTGQHGIHFCQSSSALTWQPTEHPENMATLQAWYDVAQLQKLDKINAPIAFEIGRDKLSQNNNAQISKRAYDLVYSANVLHIISPLLAKTLVEDCATYLQPGQKFVCYGPFKHNGLFTTESNAEFDHWLKSQGYGGMHDMKDIELWSESALHLIECKPMPANNFLLVYEKR